ncbi:MAG: hypothetical protein BWK79_19645 [Beggiatoa sp. IS2]|nr:MAG: hypothetical protein BWK79_19645 [Beggiatoa sp. IS2]
MSSLRTISYPQCYLCGTEGSWLYQNLADYLFRVPGQWQLKTCNNPACQLVWLDPMPIVEDLPHAYLNYYTHVTQQVTANSILHRLDRKLYKKIRLFLAKVTGMSIEKAKSADLFLSEHVPGKLLDVGCGDGRFLVHMHDKGWEVEGTDFDPGAVETVRKQLNLTVHLGNLADIHYPDQYFDAITLKHVIEHIPKPLELLIECRRILKPSGQLVLVTPNMASWGHRYFRQHWRGLEPPRHLFLFSPQNLSVLTQKAGFHSLQTFTTAAGAEFILAKSDEILRLSRQQQPRQFFVLSTLWLLAYYEWWAMRNHPEMGEELVVMAKK